MPTSSTGAVYSCSSADNEPQASSNGGAQLVTLAGIPNDPSYSIDRFLNNNNNHNNNGNNSGNNSGKIAVEYQRPPIEFRQKQDEAEAESNTRARILAQLRAFDKKLASTSDENI